MILILGSTHDDILYFESVMANRRQEKIYNIYPVEFGTIFNQDVVLVYDIYTSYMSALITNYILEKYFIVLVFVVGKCVSFSKQIPPGEIVLSKRAILGDVDQVKEANVKIGQLPHFPRSLEASEEVIGYLIQALEKRSFSKYSVASFISSNGIMDTHQRIDAISSDDYVLGHKGAIVFDCTAGGAFLACNIKNIPVVSVKVVERIIDEKSTADTYINVLKQYASVGRAIVTCIGDIGRNDIMRE